jgi:hypothetical protein
MPQAKKHKKKSRKTKRGMRTKITLVPEDDVSSEEEDSRDEDFDEGGMFLDKESIQLIYNSLREYKPTEDEEHLLSVLLEEFEEILVVDYKEPYPDVN